MLFYLTFLFLWSFACQDDPGQLVGQDSMAEIQLNEAFSNLSFQRPVDLQSAKDQTNRLFVVEQRGVISVFENEKEASKSTFLDISARVDDKGNEEGLLGLAFHPDYQSNGYFFVNYTANRPDRTVISRFKVDPSDANQALPDSEEILLEFDQPHSNHNGGQVAFGPDGYLYIAVGDGGSGGDPHGHGQNLKSLLATILRIDVNQRSSGKPYSIPSDNPFVGNTDGSLEEIFAFGLRNPWRMSFDSQTGDLWAGDVGQNAFEEIDLIEKGGNYGWNTMEALHCFESSNCDQSGLIDPVWEYSQSNGDRSVTGGFVYRGAAIPELQGKYIYADYVSGRIWTLEGTNTTNATNTLLMDTNLGIAAFGVDAEQELYVCAFNDKIYKFEKK